MSGFPIRSGMTGHWDSLGITTQILEFPIFSLQPEFKLLLS
jgi:hypothetical protein